MNPNSFISISFPSKCIPNIVWFDFTFSLINLQSTKFILLWLISKWIKSIFSLQKYSPKATAKSEGVFGFTGTFLGSLGSSAAFWFCLFLSFLSFSFFDFSSMGGRSGFLLSFNLKESKASSRVKLSNVLLGYFISELTSSS